jgi:hypothetical protein
MNNNIISQFIPIILIFLLLSYSDDVALFSHSILGKLISIIIIIYYTILDKYIGLLVCLIIILYYQSDYVENLLNINKYNSLENFSILNNSCNCENPKPLQEAKNEFKIEDNESMILKKYENYENYKELYEEIEPINSDTQDTFRTENCSSKGTLQYKDMEVKNDMAGQIFPELNFKDQPCNPCSKTCNFSIIESKIKTEDELKPKILLKS